MAASVLAIRWDGNGVPTNAVNSEVADLPRGLPVVGSGGFYPGTTDGEYTPIASPSKVPWDRAVGFVVSFSAFGGNTVRFDSDYISGQVIFGGGAFNAVVSFYVRDGVNQYLHTANLGAPLDSGEHDFQFVFENDIFSASVDGSPVTFTLSGTDSIPVAPVDEVDFQMYSGSFVPNGIGDISVYSWATIGVVSTQPFWNAFVKTRETFRA